MSKSVTIRDIAREAGVSFSTVSRVLSGSIPVAAEKRALVLAAAERLNYRPNLPAQWLARGSAMAIGVLSQSIRSPFYGEILKGIEAGLVGSGYAAIFASGNWHVDDERAALTTLVERCVDALIVVGGQLPDEQLLRIAGPRPLVGISRPIGRHDAICLRVENVEGSYKATRYLIELGHRKIAHIMGIRTHLDAAERLEGYCAALRDAGLEVDPALIVEASFSEQSGLLAVETLLARGMVFTAIVAGNDQIAYGARLALFRHGIRVPEDISLVGFDDQPGSAYTTPPLTTVRQPTFEMGMLAAQTALRVLRGEEVTNPSFPTELVIRESAALCRYRA